MAKTFYLITILLVVVSCNTKTTHIDKEKERINGVCDMVMSDFRDGKISHAMQLLKSNTSMISSSAIDTLELQVKQQIKNGVFNQYGEILSYELIEERKLKDFAAKKYYALKSKDLFLKFVFTLYNSGSGWKITGFKYNEDMSDLY
jgi:hypothetical protein